jgi:radical SAM superfamily enzyme YgiQ (UPF0313 family)
MKMLERLTSLDILFRVFARIDDLTPSICAALAKAGCIHVALGLESLNPDNLTILGKARQIGKESNVRFAQQVGLTVRGFFMVGLPYDTDANIERDFATAATLGLDEFTVYPLIPYPGTKIGQNPEQFGYTIVHSDFRDYVQIGIKGKTCYSLRHTCFGPEDVERWKQRAEQLLQDGGSHPSRDSKVTV